MASCWVQHTPYNVYLDIICLILLPIIALFGGIIHKRLNVYEYQYGCEDYCSSDEKMHPPPDEDIRHDIATRRKRHSPLIHIQSVPLQKYSLCKHNATINTTALYMVSLLKVEHHDAGLVKLIFLGTGHLVANNVVLTTFETIDPYNTNVETTIVRVGSTNWTDGGVLHNIEKITFDEKLIILHLKYPVFDTINLASLESKLINFGEMFDLMGWSPEGTDEMNSVSVKLTEFCSLKNSKTEYCAIQEGEHHCHSWRSAGIIRNRVLIGVHTKMECKKDMIVHYFEMTMSPLFYKTANITNHGVIGVTKLSFYTVLPGLFFRFLIAF